MALAAELRDALVQSALDVVVAGLAQAVLDEADRRRQDGSLQFQDLLVLARNVLRDSEAARMAAHQRYQRLLLDEFQDTDPIQIEIAVRIVAGGRRRSCRAGRTARYEAGASVLRRRPEAVDLPVPSGGYRACSSRKRRGTAFRCRRVPG